MMIDLSFNSVRKLVRNNYSELIDEVDALSGLILLVTVATTGNPITAAALSAAVGTLSSLLTVKNEFPKLGKKIIEKITSKNDNDPLALQQRMEVAYCLICYTAFFDALSRSKQLVQIIEQVKLTPEDKLMLLNVAQEGLKTKGSKSPVKTKESSEHQLLDVPISFPHPVESFDAQCKRLQPLYTMLAKGTEDFLEKFAAWENADERKQELIKPALNKLSEQALECFRAEYYFLAAKYQEFYVWSNLQEREDAKKLLTNMSTYVQKYADIVETGQRAIDLGFHDLAEAIKLLPEQVATQVAASEVDEVMKDLKDLYNRTIEKPIIEDPYGEDGKPHLTYPKRSKIFIPQAFRALYYTGKENLENEATWESIPERNDLGLFLLSYLHSPYSNLNPLIILGQPGSGKSLLTSMLAARLFSPSLTPLRIELRNTNADIDIESQIEAQIRKDSGWSINWAKLARYTRERPTLVLFDGYDELLQASGKVFSGYPLKVQRFQQNEYDRGRPVSTIVTSRITLIDKAEIPRGATIIRLLEFDPEKQKEWMSVWNSTNAAYFLQTGVEPFELPEGNEKVHDLAKQPLLLLMLALYDSEGNQLRNTKMLDETLLYDRLLRQFIERECKKEGERFEGLSKRERDETIERNMERLGVAAVGMFNRRSLHIQATQLSKDIGFFDLEKKVQDTSDRLLTQADFLLGSFFFVQKSQAKEKNENQQQTDTAFEFLHNTFGEFLTADFILRKVLQQTDDINLMRNSKSLLSQRMTDINSLPLDWFACFMYAPLFSRPVILSMMRQWLKHGLKERGLTEKEFLKDLDIIVTSHIKLLLEKNILPTIMMERDKYAFGDLPLVGYIAIYSLNLVTLRIVLSSEGYIFDESKSFSSKDGTRVWDQLTYLWRAWFSLETLNSLAAILTAERQDTQIHLKAKDAFEIPSSTDQLDILFNVSRTLADNITAGLSGLLLHDSFRMKRAELDDIERKLSVEQLNLTAYLLAKHVRYLRREKAVTEKDLHLLLGQTSMAILSRNEETLTSLLTELYKLARDVDNEITFEIIDNFIDFASINEELAVETIKFVKETDSQITLDALRREYTFKRDRIGAHYKKRSLFNERGARSVKPLHELDVELIKLAREDNPWQIPEEFGREYLEEIGRYEGGIPIRLATEWIKLVREVGDPPLLDYFSRDYTKEILCSKRHIPVDLAIELVKLARDTGNQDTLLYFIDYLKERLSERRPVSAKLIVEVIKGARDIANRVSLVDFIQYYLITIGRMERLVPFEAMTEILKLAREIGDAEILKRVNSYLELIVREKRRIPAELAVELIKLARMIDEKEALNYFRKDYLKGNVLQPRRQIPIELAVELIALAQEAADQASAQEIYQQNVAGDRCYIYGLPLDAISNIHQLAKEFHDDELLKRIERLLGLRYR